MGRLPALAVLVKINQREGRLQPLLILLDAAIAHLGVLEDLLENAGRPLHLGAHAELLAILALLFLAHNAMALFYTTMGHVLRIGRGLTNQLCLPRIAGIPQTFLSSPWGRSGSRCLSCTEAGDVHAECTTPDFESTPMCAFAATNFAASALYSSIIAEMGQSVEMSALACDQQETSTRCYQARPLEDKSPPGGKPVGAGSCAEFADLAGFFIGVSPQAAGISSSPGPDRAGTWPASSSGRHGEDCFRRQARRVAHALPPSELVVACALRASLSEFLQDTALPRRLRILLRCYREPNRPSHCHDYGLNTAA